jgi:hypothetical protein
MRHLCPSLLFKEYLVQVSPLGMGLASGLHCFVGPACGPLTPVQAEVAGLQAGWSSSENRSSRLGLGLSAVYVARVHGTAEATCLLLYPGVHAVQ